MITLDTLKDSIDALHLTTEQEEQILEIIETAYSLGGEVGYDKAKSNFTPIILELMGSVETLDELTQENLQVPMKLTDKQILVLAHSHFEDVYHPPGKYGIYGVFEVAEHQILTFARALEELA